ncbi:MAG: alpha/beta fold hydrolase [Myxococcota bacterium]
MTAWRREAAALAQQGYLIARSKLSRRSRLVLSERGVVVFVHGFLAAGPVFDPLSKQVRAAGFGALDLTYGPFRDFESVASELKALIDDEVPAGIPVTLVGHSLGGLLARWYLQVLGGDAARLITMATPHAGTLAGRGFPSALVTALRPGSRILRRLGTSAGDVPHVAIFGEGDTVVSLESAGVLEDAEVRTFPRVGHNELLYDEAVQREVLRILTAR